MRQRSLAWLTEQPSPRAGPADGPGGERPALPAGRITSAWVFDTRVTMVAPGWTQPGPHKIKNNDPGW